MWKCKTYKLQELLNKISFRLKEFDEDIFKGAVEKIISLEPGIIQFHFINGAFIDENYETKVVKERRKDNGPKECCGNSSFKQEQEYVLISELVQIMRE